VTPAPIPGNAGVTPALNATNDAARMAAPPGFKPLSAVAERKARGEAGSILHRFLVRLQEIHVLDPACGSGNFLYVALLRLKDLEKEAILYGNDNGLGAFLPLVGPSQLHGIEINPYAHDLAQMTVWIGWLQWIRVNGFGFPADPILRPLTDNIRRMDSILAPDGTEPDWPKVDFIIGNPPFLGDKLMRRELGDDYVDRLRTLYADRIPGQSDLCCYWFEKARAHIAAAKCNRAGLLATQGVRGGANREILKRIKETGGIFWAESDRPWILDGANVHVSMVGFDDGKEETCILDGKAVPTINANLTANTDMTVTASLLQNSDIAFQGPVRVGDFDVSFDEAFALLLGPNPHQRPNSDVLRPSLNGTDNVKRPRERWVIDFGRMDIKNAALYEQPFSVVERLVKPMRLVSRDAQRKRFWWLHGRTGDDWRAAVASHSRFIGMAQTAKHSIFRWHDAVVSPEQTIIVFARSNDYFFGVLHSRFHEVWALAQGTQLREKESGFRYTPTTCFETFPFPGGAVPTALNATDDAARMAAPAGFAAIASAAKELNELRETWLNPPEWTRTEVLEFPGTVGGPWHRYIDPATVTDRGTFKVGTVRYPRLVARDTDCAARLKKRTLTNLYNERPPWLADNHTRLDTAVAAAYGWPADLSDEAILERLLALNLERSRQEAQVVGKT
jgi:type II restriction/modification system DNA methylase subunit YeeA